MALTRIPLTQTDAATGFDTISTSNPTTSSNKSAGHLWLNKTTGEAYTCTDATAGANVWTNVGDQTGIIEPITTTIATGGTIVTSGDYKIHTFTSSGNFVVTQAGAPIEYLLVAGGGGGGSGQSNSNYAAGGGGGGGMITANNFSVSNGTYAIVVGAGGAGQAEDTNKSYSGTNSLFSTLIATGGGGGGPRSNNNRADHGQAGGSGGGAGCGTTGSGAASYAGGIAIANKIPTMTSNTAPYGTAFASQNGSTSDSSACWKAFDEATNTSWKTTSTGTSFAGVDFGFNFTTGFVATGYTIALKDGDSNQAPKDWTFQGSNDGSSWTTLDTRANFTVGNTAATQWGGYGAQKKTFTFSNSTSYTRYKWVFTGSQSSGQEVFITSAQIFTAGGQGNNGGNGGVDAGGGGGGGGASAIGTNGATNPGAGGAGLASTLSGSSVTYAGGGGGGAGVSSSGGNGAAGGTGGGGAGSSTGSSNAVAGTVNTGGGGGGAGKGYQTGAGASAAGGSGVVILKYKFQ